MTDPLGPSDPQFWLLVAGVATVFALVRLAPALLLGRGHRISPGVLHTRLTEGTQLLLLDVRGKHEYDDGHIAGARWVPSSQLTPLLRDRGSWLYRHPDLPIVTICHSGVRAALVASRLRRVGFHAVTLAGGMSAWLGDYLPTVRSGHPAQPSA